jgi:heme exporter protein CcmB
MPHSRILRGDWSRELFAGQFRRDITAALRSIQEALNPLVFLFLAITLFALGMGAEPAALERMAPGIIWVLVLLANLLALEGLFRRDFDDGTLEQMVLLGQAAVRASAGQAHRTVVPVGLGYDCTGAAGGAAAVSAAGGAGVTLLSLLAGSPALTLLGCRGCCADRRAARRRRTAGTADSAAVRAHTDIRRRGRYPVHVRGRRQRSDFICLRPLACCRSPSRRLPCRRRCASVWSNRDDQGALAPVGLAALVLPDQRAVALGSRRSRAGSAGGRVRSGAWSSRRWIISRATAYASCMCMCPRPSWLSPFTCSWVRRVWYCWCGA